MSFENFDLHPSILKAIQRCGYTKPTSVQSQAIPKVLAGFDVIASANTGTGKTASFVLPALQLISKRRFVRRKYGKPSVLILTPTRELANQVSQAIRTYGKFLRFSSISLVGGVPYGPQLKSLSRPVDIVVATPGRLIDLMNRRNIDLSEVKFMVLDEADRMLDMGFVDEVTKIADMTAAERQTVLFTATWDNTLAALAQRLLNEPQRIQIDTKNTQQNIEQRLHVADDLEHKNRLLDYLLEDELLTQAIIFSATKVGADRLAKELRAQGHAAAALHGDMKQGARNRTLTNLRRGKLRLLVATDVAARGIDVSTISHVINFDIPRFAEDYVHRIGRTGRAGSEGTAISFALPDDLIHLERIERYTGQKIPQQVISGLEPTRRLRRPKSKKRNSRRAYSAPNNRKSYRAATKNGGRYRNNQPPAHAHKRRQRLSDST